MTQPTKPASQSKTIWLAILTGTVGTLAVWMGNDWVATHPGLAAALVACHAAAQAGLRLMTDQPVKLG